MASTAMGNIKISDEEFQTLSESDFDSDAVLVPAACLAHGVWQLG